MGAYEATKVAFARLQVFHPNLSSNIISMLLAKDNNEIDMIRLACGLDNLLHPIIAKACTNDTNKHSSPLASWGFPSARGEKTPFVVNKVGSDGGKAFLPEEYGWRLPMGNISPSTINTHGWKPCLYFKGVTMHLGSEDIQKYSAQTPQIDKSDWINNHNARQIYLTFSPDSIFSKEDVFNYFSIYGMVQDVRIPYQEKRMFGFVTFACQMTVKLILARGNPHYICDARILVKPYKEKEKVSNKFRHDIHCLIPLLHFFHHSYKEHYIVLGPRILYKDIASHDSFIRMNLEEEQQATEQWKRCLMRLKLLNLQNKGYHLNSLMAMGSHVPLGQVDRKDNVNENDNPVHLEDTTTQDNRLNGIPSIRETASGATSIKAEHTINSMEEGEFGAKTTIPDYVCGFLESEMKYNLPDSPFSSPTKASNVVAATYTSNITITSPNMVASNLFSPNIHP
uniref:RRM domain-containing protein n=1 Tax=Oryza brachyantha TaxID=4533 RepID=J3NAY7_ORYBR